MRHDRKFSKRRKGVGSLARSPSSFWNECINSPIICLPHPHTSKSSHIALTIAAFQQALAKHPTFISVFCTVPLSSSSWVEDWDAVQGCFGFALREDEAEEVQICWSYAALEICSSAALPELPLTSLQNTLVSITAKPTPCPKYWAAPLCLPQGVLAKFFKHLILGYQLVGLGHCAGV